MNTQNNTPLVAVIAVLAVLVIGGVSYIIYQSVRTRQPVDQSTSVAQVATSPNPSPSAVEASPSTSPALKTTGSTNADLSADLNDVDASLKVVDTDQTNATQGLNDKQTDLSSN